MRDCELCGKFTFIFRKKFSSNRKHSVTKLATSQSARTLATIMKKIAVISILFFFSCNNKTEIKTVLKTNSEKLVVIDTLEFFSDSTNFGNKKLNKIIIYKVGNEEKTNPKVYLY